jgi:hypothetical protein
MYVYMCIYMYARIRIRIEVYTCVYVYIYIIFFFFKRSMKDCQRKRFEECNSFCIGRKSYKARNTDNREKQRRNKGKILV